MTTADDVKRALAELPAIDWDTLLTTASGPYGITDAGYLPKPYARLLAESLALARNLLGPEVDVAPGSVIRKLLEMSALEHARTYALLANVIDDLTVPTARGDALTRLGEELGLPRPFLTATGKIKLSYAGPFNATRTELTLPAGLRLLTSGGHHVALSESVKFTSTRTDATLAVEAYHPGPEHNLDPTQATQKIDRWNPMDPGLAGLLAAAADMGSGTAPEAACKITHDQPLMGGEKLWPDDRYRQLLLRAPRSIWTAQAMEVAVGLVPGVRQVKIVDLQGGLDIDYPIFGSFNFGERVFGTERDLASPYYFTVLVAPTAAAIWDGADGLAALVAETLEDLRPIGVFPEIREASEVNVGVRAEIVVDGVPLPSGDRASVNASAPAQALKKRIVARLRGYINALGFGEAVSPAKAGWAIMNETGVADVRDLRLTRYPKPEGTIDFASTPDPKALEVLACGAALRPQADQVALYVDDTDELTIV